MVASTVGEIFAAKLRSSVQRGANPISRDTWGLEGGKIYTVR